MYFIIFEGCFKQLPYNEKKPALNLLSHETVKDTINPGISLNEILKKFIIDENPKFVSKIYIIENY